MTGAIGRENHRTSIIGPLRRAGDFSALGKDASPVAPANGNRAEFVGKIELVITHEKDFLSVGCKGWPPILRGFRRLRQAMDSEVGPRNKINAVGPGKSDELAIGRPVQFAMCETYAPG